MVFAQLPTRPRIGEKLHPTRVDIQPGPTAVEDTLEAMASGARLITRPHLEHGPFSAAVDLLVRMDSGLATEDTLVYAPAIVTGHSVAKSVPSDSRADCRVVSLDALGLGTPLPVRYRHRTAAGEAQKVAVAHVILESWGFASGEVCMIGRAGARAPRAYFLDATLVTPGLSAALMTPVPTRPSRVKECKVCEFHNHCRAELLDRADVSLLLPGDRNRAVREEGISTLYELRDAHKGEQSELAAAWLRGDVAVRRPLQRWITNPELWCGHDFHLPPRGHEQRGREVARDEGLPPTAPGSIESHSEPHKEYGLGQDGEALSHHNLPMQEELSTCVELDVDMEAHPNRGTFLWGVFNGRRYLAFTDFSRDGDEGLHVAQFWNWLMDQKTQALGAGKNFVVWVYATQGENHWLRHYARAYGGQDYGGIRMPTIDEVEGFIASPHWCDVFAIVRQALLGTDSLGLKAISPLAGFTFSQDGVDGKAAIALFEQATGYSATTALVARRTLEKYNRDDCVATRYVREWLRRGAPGIREAAVASSTKRARTSP